MITVMMMIFGNPGGVCCKYTRCTIQLHNSNPFLFLVRVTLVADVDPKATSDGCFDFPDPQHRSLVYMLYGCMTVLITMGWTYVSLILSHCVLIYSVALLKKKWMCFLAGLTSLATFKMEPFNTWQVSHKSL